MPTDPNSGDLLESRLDPLRGPHPPGSAERIQQGINQRIRKQRRLVFEAALGTLVAVGGSIYFALQGDPLGYYAMPLIACLFIYVALSATRSAIGLAKLESGPSMLSSWRRELKLDLRETIAAQIVSVPYVGVTAWVVWRHGTGFRSTVFILVSSAICAFAAYQFLVVRPALKRELRAIDEDGRPFAEKVPVAE